MELLEDNEVKVKVPRIDSIKHILKMLETRISPEDLRYIDENKLRFLGNSTNIFSPYDKQLPFFNSKATVRVQKGGNQQGKSLMLRWEGLIRACATNKFKLHPITERPLPIPSRGRFVFPSFRMIATDEVPELKKWVPKTLLYDGDNPRKSYDKCWEDSFSKEYSMLTLNNGSTFDLLSYDQDVTKFEKVKLDWIMLDEECPQNIYEACLARLLATGGCLCIGVTMLLKSGWMIDELIEKSKISDDIDCFNLQIWDNPYLGEKHIKKILNMFSAETRIAREKGELLQLAGQVYPIFNESVHCVNPFTIPDTWTHYHACDCHPAQPFRYLWASVNPKGEVYFHREQQAPDMTIAQHSTMIKGIEGNRFLRDLIFDRRLDPQTGNAGTGTGTNITYKQEFAQHGIYYQDGQKSKEVRQMKLKTLLQYDPDLPISEFNKPKAYIFSDCYELIKDLKRQTWLNWQDPKMFHCSDCAEWISCTNPHYREPEENSTQIEDPVQPQNI